MRYILLFWGLPLGFFWAWYYLSFHDISFGMQFFSRPAHDFVFQVYGYFLGVEPEAIPAMIAKACIVDTFLIAGILAWRRRRRIMEWWRARGQATTDDFRREALESGQERLEG